MLLNFKIRNFRSIRESVRLSMEIEKRIDKNDLSDNIIDREKNKLVKSLLIFGRNASGKSNTLIALSALKYLVLNSNDFSAGDLLPYYEPFLFDDDFAKKPVEFGIGFVHNNIKFNYNVKYNSKEILYEALHFYPSQSSAKLFERKGKQITFGDYYKGNGRKIEKDMLKNQLFLSISSKKNVEYLNDAYLFFSNMLQIRIIHDSDFEENFIKNFAKSISKNQTDKSYFLKLLKAADTNIEDIKVNENPNDRFRFPDSVPPEARNKIIDSFRYDIKTRHRKFKEGDTTGYAELDFDRESLGTKKLLSVGSQILETLSNGGVLIVDELDKSLHPLLTRMLIKLFHNPSANARNAQIIFATHDSSLLDNELFRRDQICFIEKEYQGNTVSYKLSDIKGVRKDIPYDAWYLSGRFKAIPVIEDLDLFD